MALLTRKAEPSSNCEGANTSRGARIYAISGREPKAICRVQNTLSLIHTYEHTYEHTYIHTYILTLMKGIPNANVFCEAARRAAALNVCMYVCMYICVHAPEYKIITNLPYWGIYGRLNLGCYLPVQQRQACSKK